jgi:bifunctional non-homologous end joining protein LigD
LLIKNAQVRQGVKWTQLFDNDRRILSYKSVLTIRQRFAEFGDPHSAIDAALGSLERLLELAAKDQAAGLGDAPWPPHFRKMEGEARRVAPSRAKTTAHKPRTKMPLVVAANSPNRDAALVGLERWKSKHTQAARLFHGPSARMHQAARDR